MDETTDTDAGADTPADTDALPLQLDPIQARVLACLIEKEATTPEQYPLSANAVQVACNQKTARDPVMALEPGAVGHALRTLEGLKLVRAIHGARVQRYDHRTDEIYAISPDQRFLLALLILRGPQTAGELLARSDRMHRYQGVEQVRQILERLETRRPALVLRLPRGGGQREDRYGHLISGRDEMLAAAASPAGAGAAVPVDSDLADRITALEAEVAQLRGLVDGLVGGHRDDER